jgi:hypothetical protein
MTEFQMTHVALVGARMDAFKHLGYNSRSELAMRRVFPSTGDTALGDLPQAQLESLFATQLPLWVHNIITDPGFPGRSRMLMALRRFEGEMRDNREDEVVAAVLSAGFRSRQLDPMKLPGNMPMRQRCSMVMQSAVWQEAYRQLESELCLRLSECAPDVERWLATSQPDIDCDVAV